MGLFEEALGALEGGKFDGILQQAAGALGQGGLQDIAAKFHQGGLGDVVQSWIGTGANLPVSADQLQAVLGSDAVQNLAGQFGVDTSHLPALLPEIVSRLTPNGQVPDNLGEVLGQLGLDQGALGGLIGGFLKS